MPANIRKIIVQVDETRIEMGKSISPPTRKALAMAVIENPFAGQYTDNLDALIAIGEELGALLGADGGGHAIDSWDSGWRRTMGWPGETGSPSWTSHSTTTPPCGATTGVLSRRVSMVPTVAPMGRDSPTAVVRVWAKVPLAGAMSRRQVGWLPIEEAEVCWAIIAQAASRSSGDLSARVSTPGRARLIRPVSVPAGAGSVRDAA